MKILLLIHTIIELAIGVILLVVPQLLMPVLETAGDGEAIAFSLARGAGFAALSVALLSGLMMMRPINGDLRFVGAGTLAAFHLGLTITFLLNVFAGLSSLPIVVLHGVLTLIFLVIFLWNVRR
ncbi:MAG: hypothetical protein D6722_28500 [Bacteroidetes bacterium]|nr:MAG: hypothetical protein D6722_28500 [Bacteroidota bacterium]